ncbi:MAG: lipopolysaccharide biosynthesis protein [Lentimicrobium sp.]
MHFSNIIERYKNSIANIGIYFLASLIPMLISLLINPLIALNMAPVDYAIVGFYNSFSSLLSPLISFYAYSYYTKRYFEVDSDELKKLKATIIQSLIYFSLLLSIISFLSLYLYMHFFNRNSAMPFFPFAFLSVFTLPLTGIFTLKLVDFKMQKKSKSFFKLSVSNGVIAVILSLLLVVICKYGAIGKLSATFGASLIMFLFCLYLEYDLIRTKFDWKIMKSMLIFVWPLIISTMLHFFSTGFDKVYLERLGNSSELGFYVVAGQTVGYIGIFSSAVSSTFQPDVYKAIVNKNWKNASKYIAVVLGSTLVIVLVFIVLAPYVIDLLTAGRYTYSAKYARILAFSQLTSSMYYVVTDITIVLGYTVLALVNKIFGVILTIAMYSFFISKWQFVGAAWGQVASYAVLMIVNIIFLIYWNNRVNLRRRRVSINI